MTIDNYSCPFTKLLTFLIQELVTIAHGKFYELEQPGTLVRAPHLPDEPEVSLSIDSRTLQPGQVFIALQGPYADGHDYLSQAVQRGAKGLIVSNIERVADSALRNIEPPHPFILQVDDTLQAFQAIARLGRRKHPLPLIGITGSNGKTTVKDMTASILENRYHVLKSHKSFNNHIGVPLTLVNMSEQHDVAVLEMGMNAAGELRHLASIAQPNIGIVTNIAGAHIGFFHSLEAIMQAKMELIQSLPADGIAVLNADDNFFEEMRRQVPCSLVTFGLSDSGERPLITARNLVAAPDAAYRFDLETPEGSTAVRLPLPGRHNVRNALAAAALVYALHRLKPVLCMNPSKSASLSILESIKHGLEQFCPSPMRMQVSTQRNVTIINDAYNANPASMAAALRTLQSLTCSGKKVAVLGDMFELGESSPSAHYEVGKLAAGVPVAKLLLLGDYASNTSQGAQDAGMAASDILIGESHEALAQTLAGETTQGDVILVKASRGMTMENVLEHYVKLLETVDT